MRFRIWTVTAAAILFVAGALELLGNWSLGAAVVLLVGTSVATAIVWEEREQAPAPADAPDLEAVG